MTRRASAILIAALLLAVPPQASVHAAAVLVEARDP